MAAEERELNLMQRRGANRRAAVDTARWTQMHRKSSADKRLSTWGWISRLIAKLWQANFFCECVCVWRLRVIYLHIYNEIYMERNELAR